MKKITLLLTLLILLTMIPFSAFAEESEDSMQGVLADHWNEAFDRSGEKDTWLCADGIYSVSLDGKDAIGSASDDTNSFFIFSDSFVGSANAAGVMSGAVMPNHSGMLFSGKTPDKSRFDFVYGYKGDTTSKIPNLFGVNQWMFDLLCDGKNLYLFGFTYDGSWKPSRIDLYTVPIKAGKPDFKNFKRTTGLDALLYKTEQKHYVFGMGITPMTETAGVKDPDGYYYFYGYRDNIDAWIQTKDLIVSRIHEKDFPDFAKLTYWNGSSWGGKIEESAVICENVSCEVSVTPIDYGPLAGKYIAVYTEMVQSAHMKYAIGDHPWGPFDTPVEFYTAPETGNPVLGGNGNYYTYNAKAHPHLSDGNKLLITYNVNVAGSAAKNCKDYTPRFLYLDLGGEIPEVVESTAATTTDTPVTAAPTPDTTDVTDTPTKPPTWILPTVLGAATLAIAVGVTVWVIKKKKR